MERTLAKERTREEGSTDQRWTELNVGVGDLGRCDESKHVSGEQ